MPTALVNAADLFYEITGTSDIPVVLVHGSWSDHHSWAPVVPGLAESFRVLTYDRRGHSRSTRGSGDGTLRQDALDLAALLEMLDLAPAHVVGSSFGGSVTLRLACDRPELFRSLTVQEPPLFGLLQGEAMLHAPLASMQERVGSIVRLLQSGETLEGARRFVETIVVGPGAWDRLPEDTRQTYIANAATWLEELDDPYWATLDLDRLRRYTGPALLTRGDRSPPFFPAVVGRIARTLPQGTEHLFAGAGHAPHIEQPADWIAVVKRFILDAAARPLMMPQAPLPAELRPPLA